MAGFSDTKQIKEISIQKVYPAGREVEGGREREEGLEFIQTFAVSNAVEIDYAVGSSDALPLPATAAATARLPRPWHECRPQLSAVCQDQGGGRQLKCESH